MILVACASVVLVTATAVACVAVIVAILAWLYGGRAPKGWA